MDRMETLESDYSKDEAFFTFHSSLLPSSLPSLLPLSSPRHDKLTSNTSDPVNLPAAPEAALTAKVDPSIYAAGNSATPKMLRQGLV